MRNRPFYLKLVTIAVIVTGFTIVYSLYSTSNVETIDYTELDIFINTSKIVYDVGGDIDTTIYLRNPYNYTIYVDKFSIKFVGNIYEDSHPAQLSVSGEPIEIQALSSYLIKSCSFNPDRAGIFYWLFHLSQ